jgi:hypothetical protein
MTSIVFDTLQCAKRLEGAGFTRQQAEAQAEEIAKVIDEQLATKKDVREIKKEIKELEERLSYKLTTRLGGITATGVAILAALHFFK